MYRWKLLVLLLVLCVAVPGCSSAAGQWRVKVGPPGNEFYEAPEVKPPSETILRWVKIFAPGAKVTEWELDSDGYHIDAELDEQEKYQFDVTPEGKLLALEYENDANDTKEEPGELVLRGTKKAIAVSDVPKAALETLTKAMPKDRLRKAWTADTIVGLRYVILVGKMAFYARPDGQVQAGGLVSKGALDEFDPPMGEDKAAACDLKEFNAELEVLLGKYKERFNFENQIKRLGRWPKNADGSFRYVVMGDSRSQWKLWSNIVKHIDGLEPKPDFVINSGDIVPKGYAREYHDYYVRAMLKTDIPFLVAIGNHDDGSDSMAREYRYLFGENALNYYFDYGKARYVFIDNVTEVQPYEQTLKWLDKTLADTPEGYRKYVCAHKPPASIEKWAYHAWDDSNSRAFTALMTKHKVDEVFLGHIHAYSTAHYNGVDYTVSGGGGAPLHDRYGPLGNVHHYIVCDVMANGTVKQKVVRFYKRIASKRIW